MIYGLRLAARRTFAPSLANRDAMTGALPPKAE